MPCFQHCPVTDNTANGQHDDNCHSTTQPPLSDQCLGNTPSSRRPGIFFSFHLSPSHCLLLFHPRSFIHSLLIQSVCLFFIPLCVSISFPRCLAILTYFLHYSTCLKIQEEDSGWGTHVCLWRIHFDVRQLQRITVFHAEPYSPRAARDPGVCETVKYWPPFPGCCPPPPPPPGVGALPLSHLKAEGSTTRSA